MALVNGTREFSICKIARDQNRASHELAIFGKQQTRTACWLGVYPIELNVVIDALRSKPF